MQAGTNGGYIKKLFLKSPWSKKIKERWKPQIGQSILKNDLEAHGNIVKKYFTNYLK